VCSDSHWTLLWNSTASAIHSAEPQVYEDMGIWAVGENEVYVFGGWSSSGCTYLLRVREKGENGGREGEGREGERP
jgi:hypothetical protein